VPAEGWSYLKAPQSDLLRPLRLVDTGQLEPHASRRWQGRVEALLCAPLDKRIVFVRDEFDRPT
jgi:hypothetical protein